MISFDVRWLDIRPSLLSKEPPAALIPRAKAHEGKAWAGPSQVGTLGSYWVPTGDLLSDEPHFILSQSGELIRIPMGAYRTTHFALSSIFGLGMQLGLRARELLTQATHEAPKEVILVLGNDCTDLRPAEESFRCYVGIAFRVK